MKPIRRILVAIKNPAARAPALASKAAQLARALGAELELFHALDSAVYVDGLDARHVHAYENAERQRALEGLDRIAARLRRLGVQVETRAVWDYPAAEAIIRRAAAWGASLIVTGRHEGKHRFAALLGLTDWNVLHASPVPVLLVKTARLYRRPAVLAAIDPSHAFAKPAKLDSEILRAGDAFARPLRGTLHAMHAYLPNVYPLPPHAGKAGASLALQILRDSERSARTRFEKALSGKRLPPARRHLVSAHPVDAIPDTARRTGSAIVVMGAISRSGMKRLFIGNTAERVLDRLDCDVLVVKPARFASRVQRARRHVRLIAAALPMP